MPSPQFEDLQLLPILPINLLKQHNCYVASDGRFRASARLLQALWREERRLPIGSFSPDGEKIKIKLGSRITEAAGRAGANFLTAEIAHIARREVAYREYGSLIDEERLYSNLLSSMPLTYNCWAPLRADPIYATRVLQNLIPGLDARVEQVIFEHSPGRGQRGLPRFTGDYTALDAAVRFITSNGRRGILGIEMKYAEDMNEPAPRAIHPRYEDIAEASDLFKDPMNPALQKSPLQQLYREHNLLHSMLAADLYDQAYFAVIYPRLNYHVDQAVSAYFKELSGNGRVPFLPITLESFIQAVAQADASAYAQALHRRYCQFTLVDEAFENLGRHLRRGRKRQTKPLALPASADGTGQDGESDNEGDLSEAGRRTARPRKSRGH